MYPIVVTGTPLVRSFANIHRHLMLHAEDDNIVDTINAITHELLFT